MSGRIGRRCVRIAWLSVLVAVSACSSKPGPTSSASAREAPIAAEPRGGRSGPCRASPSAPLDLGHVLADEACKVSRKEDTTEDAKLPPGVEVRAEPAEVTVRTGGNGTFHVIVENRGSADAVVVLLPYAEGGLADMMQHPDGSPGFRGHLFDTRGRRVDGPEGAGGIGNGPPTIACARFELEPGASAHTDVVVRALGYDPDKDYKTEKVMGFPGYSLGAPKPLAAGSYRVDVAIPTLDRSSRKSASAKLTVIP